MFFIKRFLHMYHKPVMSQEVLNFFKPNISKLYLDMTFGNGGHTKLLLDSHKEIKLYGLDQDPTTNKTALMFENQYRGRFTILSGKFSNIDKLLPVGIKFDGILFDLGCSSMQFDDADRGFSISKDGPLDMRMNNLSNGLTAKDAVNNLTVDELYEIIYKYGEEKQAEKISNAIVNARNTIGPIKTTHELKQIIESAFFKFDYYGVPNMTTSAHGRFDKLGRYTHIATKTFQALRMFVNDEMNELDTGLRKCHTLLKNPYGHPDSVTEERQLLTAQFGTSSDLYAQLMTKSPHSSVPYSTVPLCIVISFHSLEDRIVKTHFQGHVDVDEVLLGASNEAYPPPKTSLKQKFRSFKTNPTDFDANDMPAKLLRARRWVPFNKKVMEPSLQEIQSNPRARSAKLRAAYRAS